MSIDDYDFSIGRQRFEMALILHQKNLSNDGQTDFSPIWRLAMLRSSTRTQS
ncbi:hypothetical protein [Glacieibacterium sp.]|uniref:hypothetical protein n=1 Tax=Glacieibacterium sp. TaxID=2860237 RepID=UPI003AFFAAC7